MRCMQYMGGKQRIAKQLSNIINSVRSPEQVVWDAFCGGLSMSVSLSTSGPVISSDLCLPLINLYKSIQLGWEPPTEITKLDYIAAKTLDDSNPLKAFIGFGCSLIRQLLANYYTLTIHKK